MDRATNAAEALAQIQSGVPEVIVSDVSAREANETESLRSIHEIRPNARSIVDELIDNETGNEVLLIKYLREELERSRVTAPIMMSRKLPAERDTGISVPGHIVWQRPLRR